MHLVNLCVNVYLDSVFAWIIVKLIILLSLLLGHLLFIILNVGSRGFALICTFVLVILFTQFQYGACTFMCNDCLHNVLQVCIYMLSENV